MNEEVDFKTLVLKIFKFFRNSRFIFIITFVIGVIAALYAYNKTQVYYQGQMLITTNLQYEKSKDFYTKDLVSVFDVLSILQNKIEEHNYDFIEKSLGVDNPVTMKSFNAQMIKSTMGDPENIIIKIELYNPESLLDVQNKIIKYCNENKFLKERFAEQKNVQKHLLSVISVRLGQFDTLYQKINQKTSNIYLNEDWDGLLNLEYLKQKYENSVSQKDIVEIVHGVTVYPEKIDKRKVKAMVYFIVVSFLGFIFATLVEFIKFVRK